MIPRADRSSSIEKKTMKGIGFFNVHNYVTNTQGEDKWDDVLRRLSQEDQMRIRSAVAVGWYELDLFGRLLRAVDASCGNGDLSLLSEVGAYEAEQDFNRISRVFVRVLSPMALFKMERRLWRHFQSHGKVRLIQAEGGIDTILDDWGTDEALCLELVGYVVRLIEFKGGKAVHARHPECRGRGDSRCLSQYRWK